MDGLGPAVGLGTLQALTEFLPVSSSGHLRLAHAWMGVETGADLLFDIVLHAGTLLAVFLVYRERLLRVIVDPLRALADTFQGRGAGAWQRHEGARLAFLIVLATLPTGVLGILLKDLVASESVGVRVVGGLLLLNAAVLWTSRRATKAPNAPVPEPRVGSRFDVGELTPAIALMVGIAQGIAVFPGISRAGLTIVTALLLGVPRMRAAEFSFLLSIPAILGAVVLEVDVAAIRGSAAGPEFYAVGAVSAAVVGLVALVALLGIVRRAQLHHFAWYCGALGAIAIAIG